MNFAGFSAESIFAPVRRTPLERDGSSVECGGHELYHLH